VKAGGVQMPHPQRGIEAEPFGGPPGDRAVEFSEPEGLKRIQCLAQGVVVEMFGAYPGSHQSLGRLVAEELGHQVQAPVGEARAVEDHRFEGLTDADLALGEVLRDHLIDQLANAEFIEHPRDQAEVLQRLALVCLCLAHSSEHDTSLIPQQV
jgi:hypothetical protein